MLRERGPSYVIAVLWVMIVLSGSGARGEEDQPSMEIRPEPQIEEKLEIAVPPGMELIEIANVRYMVPKGTKVREDTGVVRFEGLDEYTGRRFLEMEGRLGAIEAELEALSKAVEEAKEK